MPVVGPLPERVVNRLIISGKRTVGDDDALEPFDGCHRIPAGHDCAHWKPVLRRQVFAIHLVGQQHIAARFFQRNTARELQFARRTLRLLKHATVGSFENYFVRVWLESRSIEQDRERHSGPLRSADCTESPLDSLYFRFKKIPVVSCAL